MKNTKFLYIIAALLLIGLAGCMPNQSNVKGSAESLLKQGNEIALEAQKTKGSLMQGDKFDDALAKYKSAVDKSPESPAAAEAQLDSAKVLAGVPIDSKPENGVKQVYFSTVPSKKFFVFPSTRSIQNGTLARDAFRQVVAKFGKESDKALIDKYGPTGAKRIVDVVDQAKQYQDKIAFRIDQENSKKTLYKIMDGLVKLTGKKSGFSYWFAIILLTVIVKFLLTPLTKAQFKSMREMQKISPLIKELQEKYKDNQQELGRKMMDLYKEHGVNPLAGCLPILIQMPILILVYTMIRSYEFQFANGTFLWIGWHRFVHAFSFGIMQRPVWVTAANFSEPDLILLVLYTVSMIVSQKLSVVDPTQAEQQKMMAIMMPLMFFFIIGYLPSAFVFYWFVFNVLQTWQQYHIIHGGTPATEPATQPSAPAAPEQRRRRRR